MPRTTKLHVVKLAYRSLLLAAAAVFLARKRAGAALSYMPLFAVIWVVYMAEMLRRFFPDARESIGCQKQYARGYLAKATAPEKPTLPHKRALAVAAIWSAVTAVIGGLYWRGLLGKGALLLLSLFFAVCDMICVLVFCPFQKWIMKNRCCITCRIYDWDYAMMFAPLLFIRSFYTWSLCVMAGALLIKWEMAVFRHPERFAPESNARLSCGVCSEKMCRYKKL